LDAIYALDVVLGLLLVMLVAVDEVGTLVTTRRLQRRSPTQAFYRYGWKGWAAMARRVRDENRRESFLSVFGPISLLGLLVVWIALFMVGWALIWLGLRDHIQGVADFPDAVYFAGTTFFTVGFGDIVAIGNVARILTLFEALTGVLTTALVIGYLPTLYGAYSRREVQLLLLDDLEEDVVTPAGIITSYGRSGDFADLDRSFLEWERWCADVFDTHTAYPMLMLFRSRQPGRSWITGLTIMLEAAVYTLAVLDRPPPREAQLLYRRAVMLLRSLVSDNVLDEHPALETLPVPAIAGEDAFHRMYDRLIGAGLTCRPFADAWGDVQALRAPYVRQVYALTYLFIVPPTFRTHAPAIPALSR
jgi:hypothetical protein